jgi:UTP:GlnB (protein PII) uridylyltransferase
MSPSPQSTRVRAAAIAAGVDANAVNRLLETSPPEWLAGDLDDLVGDLQLVAPPLEHGQLRLRVRAPSQSVQWELTVVAHDRPGLLAATAVVCATHGIAIRSARAASWPGLALQRMMIVPSEIPNSGEPDWTPLGQALRAAFDAEPPLGPATASASVPGAAAEFTMDEVTVLEDGALRLTVSGHDRVGLLSAITTRLARAGADIRFADLRDTGGLVRDVFVVTGLQATDIEEIAAPTPIFRSE